MRLAFVAILLVIVFSPAQAGLSDWVNQWLGEESASEEQAGPGTGLTEQEMTNGVLEALSVGVRRAVEILGQKGGFLNDQSVRIPMPEQLQRVEKLLRRLGQDRYADQFVESMNRAAERAVPRATEILLGAIKDMRMEDARNIIKGPDDAATRYFESHTRSDLEHAFLPIVRDATEEVQVTSYYKKLMDRAGGLTKVLDPETLDLDRYVTNRALDGLFLKLAQEEKRIRENPVARTTELLKRVFGAP